jgi:hypothetical protein
LDDSEYNKLVDNLEYSTAVGITVKIDTAGFVKKWAEIQDRV